MVSRGIEAVEILDDTFTTSRSRVDKIFELIKAESWRLEYRIRSRVTLVDEKLLKEFKSIGGRAVSYGMESGCDSTLKLMNKGTTVALNEKAARITKKAGLICHSTWIPGYPGESKEDFNQTMQFVKRINPTTFNFGPLIPWPGTTTYLEAKEKGLLVNDWSINSDVPYVKNEVWPDFRKLSKEIDQARWKLLMNPRYLLLVFKTILEYHNIRLVGFGIGVVYEKILQKFGKK
jgi:radical SAM superfamily enzyme YgiQ (UPF0313 family)